VYQAAASDPEGSAVNFTLLVAPEGMAVDAATGRLTWTPGASVVGNHDVTLQATDALGAAATQTFVLTVVAVNLTPIITSVPPRAVHIGTAYEYDVEAFDPEGDPVTYGFETDPPAGMTIDAQTGALVWIPESAGDNPVSVRASDSGTGTEVQTFVVEVFDDPVELFSPEGAFEAFVGETLDGGEQIRRALHLVEDRPAGSLEATQKAPRVFQCLLSRLQVFEREVGIAVKGGPRQGRFPRIHAFGNIPADDAQHPAGQRAGGR